MEPSKKLIVLAVLLICNIAVWGGGKNDFPDDFITIEALIDAHKKMKKAEDLAVVELTAITETQNLTQRMATKYNQTRSMLNERLADVGSYVSLISSIGSIALQLKNLTESYAEFTETAYKNAKRQPFLVLVYTNANLQIANEIKHITKCCADFALFQSNVLKATMAEKRQILGFIAAHIASTQRIINRVSLFCRSVLATGVQEYHVLDIVNSKTNQEIINKIIAKWKTNAS